MATQSPMTSLSPLNPEDKRYPRSKWFRRFRSYGPLLWFLLIIIGIEFSFILLFSSSVDGVYIALGIILILLIINILLYRWTRKDVERENIVLAERNTKSLSGFKPRHTLRGDKKVIRGLAWSPTGHILASGSLDRTIRLWDAETAQLLHTLKGHSGFVFSVAWSPTGHILASGSLDKTIRLWDAETMQLLHTLKGHSSSVLSIAWSPDGRILASGSADETIRIWDSTTGREVRTIEGHTDAVLCVSFSSEGRLLASKSLDWTVRLWNWTDGKC